MHLKAVADFVGDGDASQSFLVEATGGNRIGPALELGLAKQEHDVIRVVVPDTAHRLEVWRAFAEAVAERNLDVPPGLAGLRSSGPSGPDVNDLPGLLGAIISTIGLVADQAPTTPIFVLEGLERADELSIEVLNAVIRRQQRARFVLLVASTQADISVPGLHALGDAAVTIELTTADPREALDAHHAGLHKTGEEWTLHGHERTHSVGNRTGCELLAHLLIRPNVDIHVLDLSRVLDGHAPPRTVRRLEPGSGLSRAEAVLDEQAIREYTNRLHALGSLPHSFDATTEIEFLERVLSRDLRPDGQSRTMNGDAERARVRIRKSLQRALDRIAELEPELGDELRSAIYTGVYCRFTPLASHTPWRVQRDS